MQADRGRKPVRENRTDLTLHPDQTCKKFPEKPFIWQSLKELCSSEIGGKRELQVVVSGEIQQKRERERFDGDNRRIDSHTGLVLMTPRHRIGRKLKRRGGTAAWGAETGHDAGQSLAPVAGSKGLARRGHSNDQKDRIRRLRDRTRRNESGSEVGRHRLGDEPYKVQCGSIAAGAPGSPVS